MSVWLRRGGWFLALWLVSVVALAVIALGFRLLMTAAGLRG